jgi:hypothetical protein
MCELLSLEALTVVLPFALATLNVMVAVSLLASFTELTLAVKVQGLVGDGLGEGEGEILGLGDGVGVGDGLQFTPLP